MKTFGSFTRKFVLPLWGWYLTGFISLALTNLITLEVPQLAKEVINSIEDVRDPAALESIALLIVGLGVLQILVRTLSRVLIFWPGRKMESSVRTYFFERIFRLQQSFFQRYGLGDLISRLANDVGHLRAFFAFGVLQMFNLGFLVLFTIEKMLDVHTGLTLICLLPLLLMLLLTRFIMPLMHKYSRQNQDAVGRLTNRITETFVHVGVVQATAAQSSFLERIAEKNTEVYETNIKVAMVRNLVFPFLGSIAGISQLAVLYYGGHEVLAGNLSVGDILAFNIYIGYLVFPLVAIGIVLAMYQRSRTALDRLGHIEDAEPEKAYPASGVAVPENEPLLSIRNLTFQYPEESEEERHPAGRAQALTGVNLTIERGRRVGLYGPIGSGKSTLFQLITRLYDPQPGAIFWNGRDILETHPRELRRSIAYALQSVHLFSLSIADNLRFGVEGPVSEEELERVTAGAEVLDEIRNLDEGWHTQIGERGVRLSGGQKQRLALARIFLRKADLILLDDVLSAVDQTTERRMIEFIHKTKSALIISSHRAAALRDCDEILMLDAGRVVDRGTFAQLANRHEDFRDEAASGHSVALETGGEDAR